MASAYLFDPDRDLDDLTRPFFIVKALEMTSYPQSFVDDAAALEEIDRLYLEEYLIWVYCYARDDVAEMRSLPENAKAVLYKDLYMATDRITYRMESIRISYVGAEDETDRIGKRLSVVSGILTRIRATG